MDVAVLFARYGSLGVGPIFAVLVITVPGGFVALACTTIGNVAVPPGANVAFVHVIVPVVPTAGVVQLQPDGVARETNVVLPLIPVGTASVNDALTVAGPLLITTSVNVTLFPPNTGFGDATLVTARSACVALATITFAVADAAVGFGFGIAELAFAVFEIIVPFATPVLGTFTTSVNVALAPLASDAKVHAIFPVPPTGGAEQLHPAAPRRWWTHVTRRRARHLTLWRLS